MPRKPKRPCSYPGCPNLTDGRFCEEHAKEEARRYEHYDRDPATKRRYGRAWKRSVTAMPLLIRFVKSALRRVFIHQPRRFITCFRYLRAEPMTVRT